MKVVYLTKANLAFSRSHVFNILKTAEAVAKVLKEKVTIVAPEPKTKDGVIGSDKVFSKHGVDPRCVSLIFWDSDSLNSVIDTAEIIYWRDPKLFLEVYRLKKNGKKVFFEVHRTARNIWEKFLWPMNLKLANGVIAITRALKLRLDKYNPNTFVVFGNAHEPSLFEPLQAVSQGVLREQLSLPQNCKIITYAGQTKNYQFREVFESIKNIQAKILLVGVTNKKELLDQADVIGVRNKIILVERVERTEVSKYIMASDILFVPFVREEAGAFPVKIFEYMGSGKPIVSFANEPIREILRDKQNSLLVDTPISKNWEKAFNNILEENSLGEQISEKALTESKNFNWGIRGEQVAKILKKYA